MHGNQRSTDTVGSKVSGYVLMALIGLSCAGISWGVKTLVDNPSQQIKQDMRLDALENQAREIQTLKQEVAEMKIQNAVMIAGTMQISKDMGELRHDVSTLSDRLSIHDRRFQRQSLPMFDAPLEKNRTGLTPSTSSTMASEHDLMQKDHTLQ